MSSFLKRAYDQVYYAAELRAQKKLAGSVAGLSDDNKHSLGDVKTTGQRVRRFFGLPAGDSLVGIAQNFLLWRSEYSKDTTIDTVIKILWFISVPIMLPVQLSLVVLKCLRNILKLGTEFLPLLVLQFGDGALEELTFHYAGCLFSGKDEDGDPLSLLDRVFCAFALLFLFPLYFALNLWHLIGRAITSPVESVRASYEWGETRHSALGVLLAGLSVALTACVYAVLFPLAIKFILMQTAAFVSSTPHWVISMLDFIAEQGVGFSSFLSSILPSSWLTAFNAPLLASLMAGLSLVGITLFGSGTAVGAVIDKVTDPDDADPKVNPRNGVEFITSAEQITDAQYKAIFSSEENLPNTDDIINGLRSTKQGKIPAILSETTTLSSLIVDPL